MFMGLLLYHPTSSIHAYLSATAIMLTAFLSIAMIITVFPSPSNALMRALIAIVFAALVLGEKTTP